MTRVGRKIVARRHGDEFQSRLFWLKATSLLDPNSPVEKVAYETGPKGFDDILVEYDPQTAPPDHEGKPILRRHIQSKWHTVGGRFGYGDLIDPSFINAQRFSLLQNAYDAQTRHAPDGSGCRFEFVTNWLLRPEDQLMTLVRKESDALDLARLFDGTTDKSRMGQVRKLWRSHLGVDDERLELVARVLAIVEAPESLASLRERLDDRFAVVGMKRVPAAQSGFLYDDLIAKLLAQGRAEFDKDSFHDMCRRERLLEDPVRRTDPVTIGVRSFMHPIDGLEDRCHDMLNLVPYFDGRYVRNQADWQKLMVPQLRDFVINAARQRDRLRVVLDAHVSLAVAVGAFLNVKSGKRVEFEQRTNGRQFWSNDDQAAEAGWPTFRFEEEHLSSEPHDTAVAIGLTHDVSVAVRSFVMSNPHRIGRILHCRPDGGASQQSVRCGRHAWMLAESLLQRIRRMRESGSIGAVVHVFLAGPNGFAFFLGQHQVALGPLAVYEWDFDGYRGGGYSLGLLIGGP